MTACIPGAPPETDSPTYQAASVAVGMVCEMAETEAQGARAIARVALMAVMLLEGPTAAASFAYQQADELADACG